MSRDELRDILTRARQMEEEMTTMLIGLCTLTTPIPGLDPQDQRTIQQILLAINNDSEKHRATLSSIDLEAYNG